MSSFIRESKFRNIEVRLEGREKWYEQLRVASHAVDGSNLLTASSQFLAYIDSAGGGTALAVLPLTSIGKNHVPVSAPAYQQPLVRAHSQPIQDLSFDPFDPNTLYSCSLDGTLKVWSVPRDGFIVDCATPTATLTSSRSVPLRGVSPHPSARAILASRGSRDISVFDVETATEVLTTPSSSFPADLQSMSWSHSGHVLTTLAKDKVLRLHDPRITSESGVVASVCAHTGSRVCKSIWLGDSPYLLSVGHSSNLDREYLLWDHRSLEKPVKKERIDGSTGSLMPIFDADTNCLILIGKGDTVTRLYEFSESELFPITSTSVGDVIRGAALLPKQANDLMSCEVLRLLKLTDNSVQPITYIVPRKEKRKFHEDLYPPSVWESPAVLSQADYLGGRDSTPARIPVTVRASTASPTPVEDPSPSPSTSVETETPSTSTGTSDAKRSSQRFSSTLKFRHMFGKENPKASTFYNLSPQLASSESPLIAASDKYWAIPYQGGGGPVYVSRHTSFGKVEPGCTVLNGHKASVLDISFSPFHSGLMATASNDCTVKVWALPEEDTEETLTDAATVASLTTHRQTVRTCNFHPVVQGMLVTSSLDMTVRFYDVEAASEIVKVDLKSAEGSQANNVSFNYDGSLVSLACKDRVIRIIDPRAQATVLETPSTSPLGRNLAATWCSSGPSKSTILSVSSVSSGQRQIHLWDPRTLRDPLSTISVDNASGQLFPIFDEGTGVCFLAGKGDTIIRYYELSLADDAAAICMKSNEFQTSRDPIAGICMLPKRSCDIRAVEAARFFKLTTDSVIPISFVVPRAENLKQYFQDDIFPPTRAKKGASVSDWLNGENPPQPILESLQPDGMPAASSKPAEPDLAARRVSNFKQVINKQEAENKQREDTFNRLQGLALQHSVYHPNASHGKVKGEAKPIIDDDDDDAGWDD